MTSLGDDTVRALERSAYGIKVDEDSDPEATIYVYECPQCGDMYVGHQAYQTLDGGQPSPCCGERLRMGELPLGQAFTPRKLCEYMRDAAGPEEKSPSALSRNHGLVPALGKLAKWLDVLVESATGVSHSECLPPEEEASRNASMFPIDQLIKFPVGAKVWTSSGHLRPVRVVGYVVKPKQAMSWDVVSPRCAECDQPTEYGEEVFVTATAPPRPWKVMQDSYVPAWAPNDRPRDYADIIDADGNFVTTKEASVTSTWLDEANDICKRANAEDQDTLLYYSTVAAIVGKCCRQDEE